MIEKLTSLPYESANKKNEEVIRIKVNEMIDELNDLLLTHPNVKEKAAARRDFEAHMTKPNEPGYFRANND